MSVLQEILTWSEELPDWQSDALSRLFNKHNLDSNDIDDLYALLKVEYGIPDPIGRTANRLTSDMIPAEAPTGSCVELMGIKDLIRVNAIANNQRLSFNPKGLTVIYGDNGSGKSGYSRVLKQACRARDQSEPILPNANFPPDDGKAKATFEIRVDGNVSEETWTDGSPVNEALSTIAIFDHRCARAYIDEEDDFSYIPYGLDIFEGLAKVCNQLKERIDHDLKVCSDNPSEFEDLRELSGVGEFIANLSSNTDVKEVEALAKIEPDDVKRHDLLYRSLNTDNPLVTADQLHRTSQRILRLANQFKETFSSLDTSVVLNYSDLDKKFLSAKAASALANDSFNKSGDFLTGTGGEAWRIMYEAARKYSEIAYPESKFPHVGSGAKCLLCQQSLTDGASHLVKFEEYVQQDIEQTLEIRQQELEREKTKFLLNKKIVNLDEEILAEIAVYDTPLSDLCRNAEKELTNRYGRILACFTSHVWTDIDEPSGNPSITLEILAENLEKDTKIFKEAAQSATQKKIVEQYKGLDAKIRFAPRKDAVIAAIEKKRQKEILEKCHSAVRTNAISLKAKEIAEKIITQDLGEALNKEFSGLGVSKLNVELKSRSDHGRPLYKLRLNLSLSEDPSKILSEGEQRAVAISSFLAEVNLNGGSCGIIFDDPVSSLDHRRRELVARRLANEANKRQVIVFTHDLYFLCVLIEEAENKGIPVLSQSLVRKPFGFGVPEKGTPFEGMSTKDRIKYLHAQYQEIEKIYRNHDEAEYRRRAIDIYRMMRDTWERAVEEVLFQNVVLRFRKSVETQRLKRVKIEESDYLIIEQGMTKCSNYAHDHALSRGIAIPDPDELAKDIESLESWRSEVISRSDNLAKSRK
jgi:energy-coupling factor transporter ATP-binding protein EcfA2